MRTVVVIPTYNAAKTLESVYQEVSHQCVDEIIVVDDASTDTTLEIARELGVRVIVHDQNRGYGATQKTAYSAALRTDAEAVVMVHGDHQYDARVISPCISLLQLGICDVILGNRIRTRAEALSGGMPLPKYLANRVLTVIANTVAGQNLGEWHSGFRAYRRKVLETIPFELNADDFGFDAQFLVQAVHFGFGLGDIPVPVRYFPEASSISLENSALYASTLLLALVHLLACRLGLARRPRIFTKKQS